MEFVENGWSPDPHENNFYEFLLEDYRNDLLEILKQPDETKHYPLEILFIELRESLSETIIHSPASVLPVLDRAARRALLHVYESLPDKSNVKFKQHIHVRFLSLVEENTCYKTVFPGCKDVNQFMGLVGTIVRTSQSKLLEYKRFYRCTKCKKVLAVEAVAGRWYAFPRVDRCENMCANGKMEIFEPVDSSRTSPSSYTRVKDYQEVKLQEQISNRTEQGTIPKAIWVILENDLVDKCKPGDDVVITGTLFLRWREFRKDKPIVSEVAFMANHVEVKNDQRASVQIGPETLKLFQNFWMRHESNPFAGRNAILQSVCPHVYGMYLVKLAICVVLAGGVSKETGGARVRGQSHLLLIGDPGTGKSQILKYVSKIIPRSVFTTGAGTTNAGLTVSAVRDNGEWHLEAGALVLADAGVCCIDEFSHIREHDRTSIHEAMEQQSISVAKAGMVCKLNTKCTVIAATNPKLTKYDPSESLELNVGLASPLLSRFDLIIALKDAQNDSWDEFLSDFILRDVDAFAYHAEQAKKSGLIWDNDTIQSYLVLVKEKNPEMTPDAAEILSSYFRRQRNSTTRNAARTTVRLLESLYRLAEGHARIMYKDFVSVHDAITAVSLVEASMQSAALSENPNSLHISFPEDPLREYYDQAKSVLQTLDLPEIWDREKIYLDHMFEKNSGSAMPPPPRPPPRQPSRPTQAQPSRQTTSLNRVPIINKECPSRIPETPPSQPVPPTGLDRSKDLGTRIITQKNRVIQSQNTAVPQKSQNLVENSFSPELFPDENINHASVGSEQAAFTSTQNSNIGVPTSQYRPNFMQNVDDEFDVELCTPIPMIDDEDDDSSYNLSKTRGQFLQTPVRRDQQLTENGNERIKRKRNSPEEPNSKCTRTSPKASTSSTNSTSTSSNSTKGHSIHSLLERFRRAPRTQD